MTTRDYVVALCVTTPLALAGLVVTVCAAITTSADPAAIAYPGGFTMLPTAATLIAAYGLHETRRLRHAAPAAVPHQRTPTR